MRFVKCVLSLSLIQLVAQEVLTSTSGYNSKKMAKPSHSGQTKQGEQLGTEVRIHYIANVMLSKCCAPMLKTILAVRVHK